LIVFWLLTLLFVAWVYQELPLWRVREIAVHHELLATSSLRERCLDVHKARDSVDSTNVATRRVGPRWHRSR
jgi:hypothetical protein